MDASRQCLLPVHGRQGLRKGRFRRRIARRQPVAGIGGRWVLLADAGPRARADALVWSGRAGRFPDHPRPCGSLEFRSGCRAAGQRLNRAAGSGRIGSAGALSMPRMMPRLSPVHMV